MPTNMVFEGAAAAYHIFPTVSTVNQWVEADDDDGDIVVGDAVTFQSASPSLLLSGMKDGSDNTGFYYGTHTFDGQTGYVFGPEPTYAANIAVTDPSFIVFFFDDPTMAAEGNEVQTFANNPPPSINGDPALSCFAEGTQIATPSGEVAVEALEIGDDILTACGRRVAVQWIGRQTVTTRFGGLGKEPVRIRANALAPGVPQTDLTVTGDHGMIVDGLVINAAALVNGHSIQWVPLADLPQRFTVYHIETEAHDVILANGAPAETFIDYAGRRAFDNYDEYVRLCGAERIIPEMDRPRISAQRLVPEKIKARLGIVEDRIDWDAPLSA